MQLLAVAAETIPAATAEMEALVRLLERESALSSAAIYVEADSGHGGEAGAVAPVTRFVERCASIVILSSRDRWKPLRRAVIPIEVRKPTSEEQLALWQALLGDTPLGSNGQVHHLASQFDLGAPAIRLSVRTALEGGDGRPDLAARVWDAGRSQARPRMADLAQRIESSVAWDDLVLPERERATLRDIAVQVRHRATVYDAWGFADKSAARLGHHRAVRRRTAAPARPWPPRCWPTNCAWTSTASTSRAVVSKYIGETEKNLRRRLRRGRGRRRDPVLRRGRRPVRQAQRGQGQPRPLRQHRDQLPAAAHGSLSRPGHPGHQHEERARPRVPAPHPLRRATSRSPMRAQRAAIWERVFPPGVPLERLDLGRLARLQLAGGNIRNMALNAAFLAARSGGPVRMSHLARPRKASTPRSSGR